MTDLRTQLTEALEAAKHTAPNHPRGVGYNEGIEAAIAIINAVLDREPGESPAPATPESPCQWSGGNDYMACGTCHLEYDYRTQPRPACPRADLELLGQMHNAYGSKAGWKESMQAVLDVARPVIEGPLRAENRLLRPAVEYATLQIEWVQCLAILANALKRDAAAEGGAV